MKNDKGIINKSNLSGYISNDILRLKSSISMLCNKNVNKKYVETMKKVNFEEHIASDLLIKSDYEYTRLISYMLGTFLAKKYYKDKSYSDKMLKVLKDSELAEKDILELLNLNVGEKNRDDDRGEYNR